MRSGENDEVSIDRSQKSRSVRGKDSGPGNLPDPDSHQLDPVKMGDEKERGRKFEGQGKRGPRDFLHHTAAIVHQVAPMLAANEMALLKVKNHC